MRSPIEDIAAIAALLKSLAIPHALIGGWAVVSWGYLRASEDIDFLIELPAPGRRGLLSALSKGWNAEWIAGGQDDPIPGMIKAEPKAGGLPVDLLPTRGRADRSALIRALAVTIEGAAIPVIAPEDLVAMKLAAGGGQDYEDARRLLEILSGKLDAARLSASCDERKVGDRLKLIMRGG
ncbi:MAG: hypothetical protein HY553_01020 [Elusimicrobia bacterium]|nr:hypothetical protein [Elusimicrobiota bacterium]